MSDITTINGLHSCKPGNDPVVGQVKLFVIEHRKGKSGKPYIKIRSANAENGGTPHRILGAEKTDFVDQHGNISFNLEVEASSSPPSTVQNLRATMQQGDPQEYGDGSPDLDDYPKARKATAPESTPHAQQGEDRTRQWVGNEDGVMATRKHLMQACNLYALCIGAVEKVIAGSLPEAARTSEQLQASLASIWIEASSRRSTDGVTWWSYIDFMPSKPLE